MAIILSLLAAATFGLNNAAVRRGVLTGTVLQALSITVPIGIPLLFTLSLVFGQFGSVADFPNLTYGLLIAAGLLHFVLGRYCNIRSMKAVGANLSGPWRQSSLLVALTFAVLFLGETITMLKAIGIVFILGGMYLTTLAGKEHTKKAAKKGSSSDITFVPNPVEGYTFAILSALCYGTSPLFIRAALEPLGGNFGIVGGFISYSAAAIFVIVFILTTGNTGHIVSMDKRSLKWFTLSGLFVGMSQLFRFSALSIAPVTVVMPIQATSNLFRLLFSWLINRQHEVFGLWVYVGTFSTLCGIVILTISMEGVVLWLQGMLGRS